jgi:hypothetical protein
MFASAIWDAGEECGRSRWGATGARCATSAEIALQPDLFRVSEAMRQQAINLNRIRGLLFRAPFSVGGVAEHSSVMSAVPAFSLLQAAALGLRSAPSAETLDGGPATGKDLGPEQLMQDHGVQPSELTRRRALGGIGAASLALPVSPDDAKAIVDYLVRTKGASWTR